MRRYNGSCPKCGHGTMYPLVRFFEDDVNESPTADTLVPNRAIAQFFPGWSLMIILTTWIGSMLFGKARLASARAKIKKAREEVLPRNPNAVICPNCYEVLERM